jgi:hypothetical protein
MQKKCYRLDFVVNFADIGRHQVISSHYAHYQEIGGLGKW